MTNDNTSLIQQLISASHVETLPEPVRQLLAEAAKGIRSVNAHHQLVEALEEARRLMSREGWTDKGLNFIDAALASAKGTSE